ncbi:MAG: stage II sporulation protein M [Oscillospiraceae bacterium]
MVMVRTTLRTAAAKDRAAVSVPSWVLMREQSVIVGLGILFLFGVAVGAAVVSRLDTNWLESMLRILTGFVTERQHQSAPETFLSAFIPMLGFMAVVTICGFCAIATPLISAVPWFRGLGFGLMATALLVKYGNSILGYLCFLILPNLIWSTVLLLMACRDALRLSISFWNAMKQGQRGERIRADLFVARMLIYGILLAGGAAVETYLFRLLASVLTPS